MSGSNSIVKLPPSFNRENEFQPFKTRGAQFFQVDQQLVSSNALTAQDLFQMLTLDASTPNVLTGPSLALIQQELNQRYLSNPGSTWEIVFHNTDVNAKTINFPGITPNQLIVPPQTYFRFGFHVTSVSPFSLNLFQGISAASQVTDPFSALGSGYVVRTGAMYAVRQILSGNPSLVVTNPAAQAGDTLLDFSPALASFAFFNETAGTGFMVRTGAGSYVPRNIVAGTGILVSNPDGQTGNPVISFNAATAAIMSSAITTTYPAGYTVAPALTGPSTLQNDLNALFAWTGLLHQSVAVNSFPFRSAASGVYDGYVSALNLAGTGISITSGGVNPVNFVYAFNSSTALTDTPVLGQTTVLTAFASLNTALNPVTPGFLVSTGPNTIVSRSLAAGANISITDPAGTLANPVISFSPSGTTNSQALYASPNYVGKPSITNANDVLIWNDQTNSWGTSTSLALSRAPFFINLRVFQSVCVGPNTIGGAAVDWITRGYNFASYGGAFGTTVGSQGGGAPGLLDFGNAQNVFSSFAPSDPEVQSRFNVNTQFFIANANLSDSLTWRMRYISCVANFNNVNAVPYPITGSNLTNLRGEVFYVDGAGNCGMRGQLYVNGTIVCTGSISAASYITTSTAESKQAASIRNLNTYLGATPAIAMVNTIQPIGFLYKTDEEYEEGDPLRYGFLADTLDALGGKYEDLVAYDPEGNKWGIKQEAILPLLFQAFKELSARVDKINTVTNVTYDV